MRRTWMVLFFLLLSAPSIRAADLPDVPMLRIEAGMHVEMIHRICTDATGRLALTSSRDKTARLWSLPDPRSAGPGAPAATLLRAFRIPIGEGMEGSIVSSALSPDGTVAALAGLVGTYDKTFSVYLYETSTGRMLTRIHGMSYPTMDIAFSPNSRYLASGMNAGGIWIWDLLGGREIAHDLSYGQSPVSCVEWLGDQRLAVTSFDGFLRLYNTTKLSSSGKKAGSVPITPMAKKTVKGGTQPYCARFSPDGKKLAVGFMDTPNVAVVDAATLAFLHAPTVAPNAGPGAFECVAWSPDGNTLVAVGDWGMDRGVNGALMWTEGGRGTPRAIRVASNTTLSVRPLPDGRFIFGSAEPSWGLLDKADRSTVIGAPPLADFRENMLGFRVAADGATVAFAFQMFGKSPAVFSVARRELQLQKDGEELPASLISPRLEGLNVNGGGGTAPTLNGQPLKLGPFERATCLAISRDTTFFLLGSDVHLRAYDAGGVERWKIPSPGGPAWAANLALNDTVAVSALSDGTIRWHRLDTGRELLAFFPHADQKRWVLWTPEGYYDCSPGAEDLIGWHVNRGKEQAADFFPAAKFRDQYYRPDVVSRVLETKDVAVALAQANEAAGRRAQPAADITQTLQRMQPPVVQLTTGGALAEATVSGDSFTVRYRIRSSGTEAVTRVRALVDGRPLAVELPIPADGNTEVEAKVPIPDKDCVLALLAENRFAVSEPATIRLTRQSAPAPAPPANDVPPALKPKLYLFAAGISRYAKNDRFANLAFAAKDAQDFAAAFQRQDGGLYQKVDVRLVVDAAATAGDVLDGLDWIKKATTAKDMAIVFLSGHGENDEELRYYFCPHDYDHTRRLRTGVAMEDIQKTLAAVPGKVLFFIDSCHAGNALGKLFAAKGAGTQVDITRLVNELSSAENGAIVFASSTGRQVSVESEEWKNGAFTKAIVEGLDGKADLLKNGKITVSTLEAWIAERVKELSEGTQTPTVAKPQTVPDFPIGLKR
jgi:WD40 repeat protein